MKIECAYKELVSLEKIIPNPRNPNTHSKEQIKLLAKIIDAQGWRAPVTVSTRSGFIVRGHGRLLAAQLLKYDMAPVDFQDYDSEAQEWADLIADNRIAELAEIDQPILKDLLQELDDGSFDMDLTGFDSSALEGLMLQTHEEGQTDDDEVPEPQESICKPGDLWVLGNHRLLCGDATVEAHVAKLMAGEKAGMVFTDPPYGVDYEGKTKAKLKIKNDKIDDMYHWLCDVFNTMWIYMSDGASYYVCCPAGNIHRAFQNALQDSQLPVHQGLVWKKDSMVLGHSDYHYIHEPILYGWKGGTHYFTNDRTQVSVFDVPRPKRSENHPTMKPVELCEKAINNSSKSNQLILDPFLGSGSTLIACEKLGRRCYGMEIDPMYCTVIINRWQNFTGKTAELQESHELNTKSHKESNKKSHENRLVKVKE